MWMFNFFSAPHPSLFDQIIKKGPKRQLAIKNCLGRPNSYYILSLKHASKYVVNKIHTTCMLYYKLLIYYKHCNN